MALCVYLENSDIDLVKFSRHYSAILMRSIMFRNVHIVCNIHNVYSVRHVHSVCNAQNVPTLHNV